ncbi:expressed unknown protein [Seminavis robusta]|uniref:Uncharacterized protein n=1 Tax=Seminavis robusta TaxID=568900 RepID=A0A9N8HEP1_9STRA|nr:expressed unknown protein [Seminavis robusta]|eukprot:Sro312_g114690.1 n/a (440) ;mRNA; r:67319-68706
MEEEIGTHSSEDANRSPTSIVSSGASHDSVKNLPATVGVPNDTAATDYRESSNNSGKDSTATKKGRETCTTDGVPSSKLARATKGIESKADGASDGSGSLNDLTREERSLLARQLQQQPQELIGAFGVGSNSCGGGAGNDIQMVPPGRSYNSPETSSNNGLPTAAAIAVNEQEEEQRLRRAEEHGRQSVLLNAVNAEVVAPQLFTKQNLQMPKFPPENEARFQAEHNHLLLSALRLLRPLAMVMNLSFFLWDVLQPEAPLLACFLVICISLVIFYGITVVAERDPLGPVQPAMCLAMLVISIQLSLTMYFVPNGFVVAAGGWGAILIPGSCALRFWFALAFCGGTVVIGNAMALAAANNTSYELYYVLIHLNMFMGTYCVFGIFFSYAVELHLRHRFLDTGTVFSWAADETSTNVDQSTSQQAALLLEGTTDEQADLEQ